MSFRARLLLTFACATMLPLLLLAWGVHRQLTLRLVRQYERRVESQRHVAVQDLARENAAIAARLATVARALAEDNRFRIALLRGISGERRYVLDYAQEAMRLSGLAMLQIQDDAGRIISSGHFRHEFDRLEPGLPAIMASSPEGSALVSARTPEGSFLALARTDSVRIAGRRYDVTGGVLVDQRFLSRLAREEGVRVALQGSFPISGFAVPDESDRVSAHLQLWYVDDGSDGSRSLVPAELTFTHPVAELRALRRDVNAWTAAVTALVLAVGIGLAAWLSARMSEPLAALARATTRIDLTGPEAALATGRDDEIGVLARRMLAMSTRLRASAGKLRAAERRATVGEMARQVNHDIRNGLVPIRNVLRHLSDVQESRPAELPRVFAERRATLDASVGYLENLSRTYAKLTPPRARTRVDLNALVREVALSLDGSGPVDLQLSDHAGAMVGDPVALRRIVENLARNALESLDGSGHVVLRTIARDESITLVVADTGRGMSEIELARAFNDFYTTKPDGTGLGLSVVRRLTMDMGGSLKVESEPGAGTRVTVDLPRMGADGQRARTSVKGSMT